MKEPESKPKVLLFDIETTPNISYTWGKWEQNVIAFKKEWQILSVAWKWIGDKKSQCLGLIDFDCDDDRELVRHIHALFQTADVIVAHNGNAFDIKKAKARFIFHKLKATKIISSIDTKLVAKRYFAFNSNSLDDLGQYLGVGRKIKHEGFDLWLKCIDGDEASWKKMKEYNSQDVELLHRVYDRLLPWIQNHPSIAKLQNRNGCPNCGSQHVQKRGLRATHASIRQQMNCITCGCWYQTRYVPLK